MVKFGLKLAELRPKPIFGYPSIAKSDYGKISKSLSSAIFYRNITKKNSDIFYDYICRKKSLVKFQLKLTELWPNPIFQYPSIGKSDYRKIQKSLSSAIFNWNFTKIFFRGFLWLNMPEKKFGKVSVEVGRAPTKTNFSIP